MITTHPAYSKLKEKAEQEQKPVHTILEETLEQLKTEAGFDSWTRLTKDLHFYPDLHGEIQSEGKGWY